MQYRYKMASINPLDYQRPVEPSALIDRTAELDVLQRAAADTVAIRLAAPRRYGKTSLLAAHAGSMREAGHRAVRVDFSQVVTVGDVAARLARAFAELGGDPRRVLDRLLTRLGIASVRSSAKLDHWSCHHCRRPRRWKDVLDISHAHGARARTGRGAPDRGHRRRAIRSAPCSSLTTSSTSRAPASPSAMLPAPLSNALSTRPATCTGPSGTGWRDPIAPS